MSAMIWWIYHRSMDRLISKQGTLGVRWKIGPTADQDAVTTFLRVLLTAAPEPAPAPTAVLHLLHVDATHLHALDQFFAKMVLTTNRLTPTAYRSYESA